MGTSSAGSQHSPIGIRQYGRVPSKRSAVELIAAARAVLRPVIVRDRPFGDVGGAVVSESGRVYTGVSIDTGGWGLCAERSAIAAMVTAGEYRILQVVAVWQEWQGGDRALWVLPPCGICRDFMRQIDEDNMDAEVILGPSESKRLAELLPLSAWPASPIETPE